MGPDNSKKFFISIGDFNTPEEDAETIQILTSAGFKSGTDFKLNIAMGDDIAHGITIYNPAMFDEPSVKAQLQAIDNPDDTYGGKTDRAAYNRLYKHR